MTKAELDCTRTKLDAIKNLKVKEVVDQINMSLGKVRVVGDAMPADVVSTSD
jgi:hypothetical protein